MTNQNPQVAPKSSHELVFLFPIGSSKHSRVDLYDSTRHYWKVPQELRKQENAVAIGIDKKRSVSAFRIHEWHPAEGKYEFTGEPLEEQHELLHRDFQSVIAQAEGYWRRGNYLVLEFDGNGQFRILQGSSDKRWKPLGVNPLPSSSERTWIFQINPNDYNLQEKESGLEESWHINKFKKEISPGDRAIIWQCKTNPGVYGIGEITSGAFVRSQTEDGKDEMAVNLKLQQIWQKPMVTKAQFLQNPVLAKMPIITGPMGTNFKVTDDQWIELLSLLPTSQPVIEDEINLTEQFVRGKASGAGFQQNVEKKQVVEQWAMSQAKQYFAAIGWTVDPTVALNSPYDLECTRGDAATLRVEVKGTETDGKEVILTRNEVANNMNHSHTALFVVYNISVNSIDGKLHAKGGNIRVIDPWKIDEKNLEALQYKYKLPG